MILVTSNLGKLKEFQNALGDRLRIPDHLLEIEETGRTYEENANLKLAAVPHGEVVIADDSGLEVYCLDARPGLLTARYQEGRSQQEKNALLLQEAKGKSSDLRARYVCWVALRVKNQIFGFEGICEGRLGEIMDGPYGFGYDPIFYPEEVHGGQKSFACIEPELKNEISHRGKAIQKMVNFLRSL